MNLSKDSYSPEGKFACFSLAKLLLEDLINISLVDAVSFKPRTRFFEGYINYRFIGTVEEGLYCKIDNMAVAANSTLDWIQ